MTLETMQREGREYWGVHVAPGHGQHHQEKILDQHTANVWKAAQESMKKSILESGLLEEKINYFRCIRQEGMAEGHNQAVRAVKGFMSNMDTNSVDSIHLNKQAN